MAIGNLQPEVVANDQDVIGKSLFPLQNGAGLWPNYVLPGSAVIRKNYAVLATEPYLWCSPPGIG